MKGFIKLHRQLIEWEWYSDIKVKTVFLHLLLTANFKTTNWKGTTIERGQTIIGTKKLGVTLGLSIQEIKTTLKKLKNSQQIHTRATNKFILVTIVNFELYQGIETPEQLANNLQSNQPATSEQPHRKNDKNIRRIYIQEDFKNPELEDRLSNFAKNTRWDDNLKKAFKDYGHYLNWRQRKKSGWGNLTQIRKIGETFYDLLKKHSPNEIEKAVSLTIEKGYVQINPNWLKSKKITAKEEITIEEYYKKYFSSKNLARLTKEKPYLIQDYTKHQESVLERKLELNSKNETLTAPLIYDVMFGLFTKAGAKPDSRFMVFKAFYEKLTSYEQNKGDLRNLFVTYLGKR